MPRRGGRHYVLVKGAEEAMQHFKLEVARDLGLLPNNGDTTSTNSDINGNTNTNANADVDSSFKDLTTEQVGLIGGTMVRRIQAAGEWAILQRYKQGIRPLMPPEALPPTSNIRNVTNTGNPARGTTVVDTLHSGQTIAPDSAPGSIPANMSGSAPDIGTDATQYQPTSAPLQ